MPQMEDPNFLRATRELTLDAEAVYQKRQALDPDSTRMVADDPWVHRSAGMRCRTCLWYVVKRRLASTLGTPVREIGRCRRHAPTMNGYPVVYNDDWCGDHKLDENK